MPYANFLSQIFQKAPNIVLYHPAFPDAVFHDFRDATSPGLKNTSFICFLSESDSSKSIRKSSIISLKGATIAIEVVNVWKGTWETICNAREDSLNIFQPKEGLSP